MQKFLVSDILEATSGKLISGDEKEVIKGVVSDSRKADDGVLFVPFKGERSNGHDYIGDVLKKGAISLTEEETPKMDGTVISVENTLFALGDIAKAYMKKYKVPTVGVTGSVGKTSTKDMISGVLAKKYNLLKSTGNHNNEIGMPLTILGMQEENDMAVLEMGMSAFGELDYLANIAKPDVAVITNIGMSHIENLGSQEGILKAKLEITNYFSKDSVLFVNGDDKFLKTVEGDFKVIRYGLGENCEIRGKDILNKGILGSEFTLLYEGKSYPVTVKAPGEHNVYNALAAIGIGLHFGVSLEDAIDGVKNVELTDMRLTVEEVGENIIIKDFYNAAPDSIRASLSVLKSVDGKRRVAILGDVLEMGEFAEPEHRKLGKSAYECADVLITAGENARFIAEGAKDLGMAEVVSFPDTDSCAGEIKKYIKSGDCILIKASRGMKFEKIYDKVKEI